MRIGKKDFQLYTSFAKKIIIYPLILQGQQEYWIEIRMSKARFLL